jgi:hypothetical protein
VPYVDKVESVKKHGAFPIEVSDMARNMKIELLTFSYTVTVEKLWTQNTRIIQMYDVYWYCHVFSYMTCALSTDKASNIFVFYVIYLQMIER